MQILLSGAAVEAVPAAEFDPSAGANPCGQVGKLLPEKRFGLRQQRKPLRKRKVFAALAQLSGNSRKQAVGIGMGGAAENIAHEPPLHHLAAAQHDHLVAQRPNYCEIVGNRYLGKMTLLAQPSQQGQNARLHGNVER